MHAFFNISTLVILSVFMSSCASKGLPEHQRVKVEPDSASNTGDWHLMKSDPPTYFPNGFPAGSPTTPGEGEWIFAGSNGEQWFIPIKGVNRVTPLGLQNEVFARRATRQVAEAKRRKMGIVAENSAATIFAFACMFSAGMSGYSSNETAGEVLDGIWASVFD